MKCANCNTEIPAGATHCPSCGTAVAAQAPQGGQSYQQPPTGQGFPQQPGGQAQGYQQPPPYYAGAPGQAPPNPQQGAPQQNAPRPGAYQQPGAAYTAPQPPAEAMTTGQWFITLLIMYIPIVGIIMQFVWAFGSSAPLAKRNFARAMLLWSAIGIALSILLSIVFGGIAAAIGSSYYYY